MAEVYQQACPLWVPMIECNEFNNHGADFFVKKYISELLEKDIRIDTILLACTHYPLLMDKIKEYSPADMKILSQGEIVAESLEDYLIRHPEIESKCSKNGQRSFYTTDSPLDFDNHATIFFGEMVNSKNVELTTS
jgi:glutamate racemase